MNSKQPEGIGRKQGTTCPVGRTRMDKCQCHKFESRLIGTGSFD